jgi:hypothetical protein
MSLTVFAYKMCIKLIEEDLPCLSLPMSCRHMDEKTYLPIGVDIKKTFTFRGM